MLPSFCRFLLVFLVLPFTAHTFAALGNNPYVAMSPEKGALAIVGRKTQASLYIDQKDHKGAVRAFNDLRLDIEKVTGKRLNIAHTSDTLGTQSVIVGTIGHSALVDRLILEKKIDVSAIAGKWDGYTIQLVANPLPNVKQALMIVGADKRGTIYGVYDLSEQIGVSPWHYFADVPAKTSKELHVLAGTNIQDYPRVKYRGIFLNDEAPGLSSWVQANHGNYNHDFYEKVFELILRLKGNFLWPAMWNNAFSDDDPLNMVLADEYGVVMSNSHHEPMMRADKEWNRHGSGKWDYSANAENLYKFWEDGAKRNKPYESIFTMGMRGQQDEPMSEHENIGLLEKIVADQREILTRVFDDRDITDVPQVWTLYKEVQSYYENGMRAPDDVILLWSDDNWGNIRRLPTPKERERSGGAGVYYHFDYVGGPRSYRWMNVVPLAKIWEQMNLAYHYEANQIWITNVGDLKPMEFPIEYFMRLAWNPERWPKERIKEFGQLWAEREFGAEFAVEIEHLMTGYTRHNGRRKPELMEPNTYSLLNYDEANRIEAELDDLIQRAEALYRKIPKNRKDAFFQLVLHPVKAASIVTKLNIAVGKNRLYANQGRAYANEYAEQAHLLFKEDAALKQEYHSFNGGKWDGFMNQSHIGYTNWNNPEGDQMPVVYDYTPGDYAEMGIAVEGIAAGWPASATSVLPVSKDRYQLDFDENGKSEYWFDVYNRGTKPFHFKAAVKAPWIKLSMVKGHVDKVQRVTVSIDWGLLPEGASSSSISIKGTGWQGAGIVVNALKADSKINNKGFVEGDGYIAFNASSFSKSRAVKGFSWQEVEQHGLTHSSMASFPISDKSFKKPKKAPYLEYDVTFTKKGKVSIQTILAPSWPVVPGRGLRYAISVGSERPQIIDFLKGMKGTDKGWETSVIDGVRVGRSVHKVKKPGPTTIRIYMVDTGVAFQKVLVDTGGLLPSYLGPLESKK